MSKQSNVVIAVQNGEKMFDLHTPWDSEGVNYEDARSLATEVASKIGCATLVYEFEGCATCGFGEMFRAGLVRIVSAVVSSEYDDGREPNRRYYMFPTMESGLEYRAKVAALLEQERELDTKGRLVKTATDLERILQKDWVCPPEVASLDAALKD